MQTQNLRIRMATPHNHTQMLPQMQTIPMKTCWDCKKPAVENRSRCTYHLEKKKEYYAKRPDYSTYKRKAWYKEYYKRPKTKFLRKQNQERANVLRRIKAYGITISNYQELIKKTGNRCCICGGSEVNKALAIDHCHNSGKVRGLLCGNCNQGLGKFKENISLLEKAIEYLKKEIEIGETPSPIGSNSD